MQVFSYDKSFDGLLSVVFDAYTLKKFPSILLGPDDIAPLLTTDNHQVITTEEKAGRVYRGLASKISHRGMRRLLQAWLAEEPGTDIDLFRYMRKTFDTGRSCESDLGDPDVFAVCRLSKKTRTETHHLCGFTRFQKTADDIFFAALSPAHNVLALLLPHFTGRFGCQKWILYDIKRHFGFFYDQQRLHDVFLDDAQVEALARNNGSLDGALLAEDEALFQKLWQRYFSAIAVKERKNPTLQARCLPRKYWKYMTEMKNTPDSQ